MYDHEDKQLNDAGFEPGAEVEAAPGVEMDAVAPGADESVALLAAPVTPDLRDESPDGKTPFSRHAIEGLYLLGAFGPREKNGLEINSAETACQTVLSAFNARKPDSEQLRFAHAFVEARVRPFLAENTGALTLPVTNHL